MGLRGWHSPPEYSKNLAGKAGNSGSKSAILTPLMRLELHSNWDSGAVLTVGRHKMKAIILKGGQMEYIH
jgi:hypothetical protein